MEQNSIDEFEKFKENVYNHLVKFMQEMVQTDIHYQEKHKFNSGNYLEKTSDLCVKGTKILESFKVLEILTDDQLFLFFMAIFKLITDIRIYTDELKIKKL